MVQRYNGTRVQRSKEGGGDKERNDEVPRSGKWRGGEGERGRNGEGGMARLVGDRLLANWI
jgi:hypothetical protein